MGRSDRRRSCLALIVALLAGSVMRCGDAPTAGGAGGETTNGIVCTVVYPDGQPVVAAAVRLRQASYVTDTAAGLGKLAVVRTDIVTKRDGTFGIDDVDTGEYAIEVNDGSGNGALIRCRVIAGPSPVDLGVNQARPLGRIAGVLHKGVIDGRVTWVQVQGMERLASVDTATGKYVLDSMPEGSYTLQAVNAALVSYPAIIPAVAVRPAETTVVTPYQFWEHSGRIVINTAAPGARISGAVAGFPLLVRLDSATFDFRQARDDGRDVRFASADGSPLAYELESWDPVAKRAALWVRVDTIRPDDSTQFIRMFWGNSPVAVTLSSGPAVFRPADGFAGVWHMSTDTAGVYADASGNGGTGRASGGVSAAAGLAGSAGRFDGVDGTVNCGAGGSLALTATLTLSAWVRLDDVNTNRYHRIISRKNVWNDQGGYELECNPNVQNDGRWEAAVVGRDSTLRRAFARLDTGWHQIAATVTDSTALVYVDGADSTMVDNYWSFHGIAPSAGDLRIGSVGQSDFLKGAVDEVRVESVARSASWIKLCYENQRPNSTVVTVQR